MFLSESCRRIQPVYLPLIQQVECTMSSLRVSNVCLIVLLVIVACFSSSVHAVKQPTSYCKCICFQNSTIIPLNSPPSQSDVPSRLSYSLAREEAQAEEANGQQQQHRTLTCNDCNRAFCLDYNLPICKNAKEEDVFAQCFRKYLL